MKASLILDVIKRKLICIDDAMISEIRGKFCPSDNVRIVRESLMRLISSDTRVVQDVEETSV